MPTPLLTISGDERTRLAQARIGQLLLGKWRLDRLIGVGGMAAVFEATHRNGNRVAITILHPDLTRSDQNRERFLAEGYAANRVSHPGAVTVRDEGTTDDGAVFLVMDLLRGKTLTERRKRGREPFSVGEVLEIASQLLDVLVAAHARGIVHGDVKPENVFLTHDGRVRLLDFGVARVEAASRTDATDVGTTFGTPAFMSPEQALGRSADLDGRSDLWSLGASMYLLLSGQPVRESGSVTEQLLGAMMRPVRSLGDVAALPRSVVAVVDRALAFEREHRFPDALSMQLAVRAALDELSAPDSRVTLPPASVEPMTLSLRTPRAAGRDRRSNPAQVQPPSYDTIRPVADSSPSAKALPRSALPLYLALGFAVGIGIVVTARLNVHTPAAAPAILPERASAVIAPPPPSTSAAPLASASASTSPAKAPKQSP
jgi:eukaryotic-like serine/threonine-protein kinase